MTNDHTPQDTSDDTATNPDTTQAPATHTNETAPQKSDGGSEAVLDKYLPSGEGTPGLSDAVVEEA